MPRTRIIADVVIAVIGVVWHGLRGWGSTGFRVTFSSRERVFTLYASVMMAFS
jgi:hypothetical protein